jgi:outer membrane protein
MSRKARIATLAACLLLATAAVPAQQITRIAVVDLQKIVLSYSKDSTALRDYEAKKTQIQQEIDRMAEEIKALQARKSDADKAKDAPASASLASELAKKTDTLRTFVRGKQEELDREAAKINSSNEFVQLVYQTIQSVAETEGYSLVLNLRSADSVMSSVLWYSSMIDITDKVIAAIVGKAQ